MSDCGQFNWFLRTHFPIRIIKDILYIIDYLLIAHFGTVIVRMLTTNQKINAMKTITNNTAKTAFKSTLILSLLLSSFSFTTNAANEGPDRNNLANSDSDVYSTVRFNDISFNN